MLTQGTDHVVSEARGHLSAASSDRNISLHRLGSAAPEAGRSGLASER